MVLGERMAPSFDRKLREELLRERLANGLADPKQISLQHFLSFGQTPKTLTQSKGQFQ